MPAISNCGRGLDRLATAIGAAVLNVGRRRIGDSYADELHETFIMRLADFRGLPPWQRLRRVGRELAALVRVARSRQPGRWPLPYPQPEQLQRVSLENPRNPFNLSIADFQTLRNSADGFAAIAGYTSRSAVSSTG